MERHDSYFIIQRRVVIDARIFGQSAGQETNQSRKNDLKIDTSQRLNVGFKP
jgi:hypothetical protein